MKKKTKLHVVVILPAIFTIIIGALLTLVLILVSQNRTAVAGAQTAPMQAASVDAPSCDFPQLVGKPVDEAALKELKRPYRILKPGDAVTMDYAAARINVGIDPASNVVTDVHCG